MAKNDINISKWYFLIIRYHFFTYSQHNIFHSSFYKSPFLIWLIEVGNDSDFNRIKYLIIIRNSLNAVSNYKHTFTFNNQNVGKLG